MLQAALSPFRSRRALGRTALAFLMGMIPVLGPVWLVGWLLDHQRCIARGCCDDLPTLELDVNRLKTGLWAYVISSLWSLPASVLVTVLGSIIVIAQVVGPLNRELSAIGTSGYQDPLAAQQQIAAITVERMLPVWGIFVLLLLIGTAIGSPFAHAAVARYNLYRTPSEGLKIRPVIAPLFSGGATSLKAIGFGIVPTLAQAPFLWLAWLQMARMITVLGVSADPQQIARALAGYAGFMTLSTVGGLVGIIAQTAAYGAWGVWLREIYHPEPGAP